MHHNYCVHLMLLFILKLKTLSKLTNCKLTKVSHLLMVKNLYGKDSSAWWWKNFQITFRCNFCSNLHKIMRSSLQCWTTVVQKLQGFDHVIGSQTYFLIFIFTQKFLYLWAASRSGNKKNIYTLYDDAKQPHTT